MELDSKCKEINALGPISFTLLIESWHLNHAIIIKIELVRLSFISVMKEITWKKGRDWFNRDIEIMFHPHWTPLHSNGPCLFQLQGLWMHCSYILDQFLCSRTLICFLSPKSQKSHFHNWNFAVKSIKVYSPPIS